MENKNCLKKPLGNEAFFLHNLWLWKCEQEEEKREFMPDAPVLKETLMSKRFIELMTNRVIMGTLRYNDWRINQGMKWDRIGSCIERLENFQKTGNLEYLVDVANLCMIEFEVSNHSNAHFGPTDDGIHCKSKNKEK
jgi:hypothetical protein